LRSFSIDELNILNKIREDQKKQLLTAYVYARKSTKDLSENSIETQIDTCKAFIQSKPDTLAFAEAFYDEERSGMFTESREAFLNIIDLVETNQIKVLIVTKWDRFSRDPVDLRMYSEHFFRNGGVILAVDDPIDLTAVGQLKYDIMAAFNHYYVHRIAEDTKAVLINKTSKGHSGGGVANYGYQFDENNFLIQNPVEAIVVMDIFDKFELGYSYQDIINDLKMRNIKTRNGNNFTKSTINDMLANVKYRGVYRYNRSDRKQSKIVKKHFDEVWVEDGVKEPIITKEQFERVQQKLALRKGIQNKSNYTLSGVMICEHCQSKMVGSSMFVGKGKPRKKYYICPNHIKKDDTKCINKGIEAVYIESFVAKQVIQVMDQYIQSDQFDISYYKATHDTKKRLKKSLVQSKLNFEKTIQKYYDMLLDPDIKEIQKPAINRLIEETAAKTNELEEKIKIADESMSMYQAIVKKKNIKTLNHDTIIEDEVLIKQIIRVMINKVVVGTQDIKIHLLEN
jgi:site-specific DNA recombinase